jgi:ABC-2 type transport system ATP-binding protein
LLNGTWRISVLPSVEAEGLTKSFGPLVAVDHLDLNVNEGEVFGMLGPNGAGKTTTLRMLACLISPSGGLARVGGYDIAKEPLKVRGVVGILTENPSLYERLTAYENMDFFAQAYGLSNLQTRQQAIRELLQFFELWDRRNDRVAILSKGMKQKLAIARALVHDPPVLFLDEPTAGLDPESSKAIRDMIQQLSLQKRHAILLCTHRLEDAEKLCRRVMIIKKGRGIALGPPQELGEKIAGRPVLKVRLKEINKRIIQAVRGLSQVSEVEADDSTGRLIITVDDIDSTAPEVIRSIVYAGGMIISVNSLHPSLEEVYLKLIKEESS